MSQGILGKNGVYYKLMSDRDLIGRFIAQKGEYEPELQQIAGLILKGKDDSGGAGASDPEEHGRREDPVLRERHGRHDGARGLRPTQRHRRHLREIQTLVPRRRNSFNSFIPKLSWMFMQILIQMSRRLGVAVCCCPKSTEVPSSTELQGSYLTFNH